MTQATSDYLNQEPRSEEEVREGMMVDCMFSVTELRCLLMLLNIGIAKTELPKSTCANLRMRLDDAIKRVEQ